MLTQLLHHQSNIPLLFTSRELSTAFGWVGTISYLIAYLLLSINKLKSTQKIYHLLNIVGATGLTYNALVLNDYPNVIVNIVWATIALIAIVVIVRRKKD
jgi:hypothetical protein